MKELDKLRFFFFFALVLLDLRMTNNSLVKLAGFIDADYAFKKQFIVLLGIRYYFLVQ